jgi:hypothetical protein
MVVEPEVERGSRLMPSASTSSSGQTARSRGSPEVEKHRAQLSNRQTPTREPSTALPRNSDSSEGSISRSRLSGSPGSKNSVGKDRPVVGKRDRKRSTDTTSSSSPNAGGKATTSSATTTSASAANSASALGGMVNVDGDDDDNKVS